MSGKQKYKYEAEGSMETIFLRSCRTLMFCMTVLLRSRIIIDDGKDNWCVSVSVDFFPFFFEKQYSFYICKINDVKL